MSDGKVCETDMFERVCSRCGKLFIIAPYHVYKLGSRVFCSYGCYTKACAEKEALTRERSEAKKRKKQERRTSV